MLNRPHMPSDTVINWKPTHLDLMYHLAKGFAHKGMIKNWNTPARHNIAYNMTKPLRKVKNSCFTHVLMQDKEY